jgi:hypothetical protein
MDKDFPAKSCRTQNYNHEKAVLCTRLRKLGFFERLWAVEMFFLFLFSFFVWFFFFLFLLLSEKVRRDKNDQICGPVEAGGMEIEL